ncbi:hypothetical protein CDAR_457231 [Caerostris darwini]|uniref:Uncharacterized protein n=1 Tax=Caerostris darwini TaxID=1538125 RepID=A0AAV4PH47_9ARAC|nr:hypothetical protein CDAR_457231 [Caerostris darwini]
MTYGWPNLYLSQFFVVVYTLRVGFLKTQLIFTMAPTADYLKGRPITRKEASKWEVESFNSVVLELGGIRPLERGEKRGRGAFSRDKN